MPAISDREVFQMRLDRSATDLWGMLQPLYGTHPGWAAFQKDLTTALKDAWKDRPDDLKRLDLRRDLEPDWFQRPDMVGYVFYADRFAGGLRGILDHLDYLGELGVTYVHIMPCLDPRDGDSDGGYSVRDYRSINANLGTLEDFEAVSTALRARGISLCIDLVLNHTAKEHAWALAARAGQAPYPDYYLMFDSPDLPDQYEQNLIEIFPETAPRSFTHYPEIGKWVWTTFNEHQWDLNWANPQVFLEFVRIMLYWANKGVDVLRFDAVAFMWKRMGTKCQSEPQVHALLHALRAASRIAAPALIHLEEAIVSPAEMLPYLGTKEHTGKEGNLAYHNSLMVQFWSALATRNTRLMRHVLASHFPARLSNATYATYLRCHDDIGWAITDEDAAALGFSGPGHRGYLSDFYDGSFPGSFARGGLFQQNPETGDKRISGSCASLCGLERAQAEGDAGAVQLALHRILMGHALIAGFGGVPLIYMGDELGLLNDYAYVNQPEHAHDSRWLHRPKMDWAQAAARNTEGTVAQVLFQGIRQILARRKATPELHADHPQVILDLGDDRLFGQAHDAPTGRLICVYNFSEDWVALDEGRLRGNGMVQGFDALSEGFLSFEAGKTHLPPYARLWLR